MSRSKADENLAASLKKALTSQETAPKQKHVRGTEQKHRTKAKQ